MYLMNVMHTDFWWGHLKETDLWENLDVDRKLILQRLLNKYNKRAWIVFIWLRIGRSGGTPLSGVTRVGPKVSGLTNFLR
jgi:hypothetical protein